MRNYRIWVLCICLAALVLVSAGCNKKVTGGGGFISADSPEDVITGLSLSPEIVAELEDALASIPPESIFDTAGDRCTFGFTAKPVGDEGAAKGQFQLVDHSFKIPDTDPAEIIDISVHSALNITTSEIEQDAAAGYGNFSGEGDAVVTINGEVIPGMLFVYAQDDDPDAIAVLLYTPFGVFIWGGPVEQGNVTVR